jgi:acyl-coenzyme A synthetase/AMP-(fatty) acid ligase
LSSNPPAPQSDAWRRVDPGRIDPHRPSYPADAGPPPNLVSSTLGDALLAAAQRHATRPAIMDERRSLSFEALFAAARAFAGSAVQLAPPGAGVAVLTRDQIDLAIAQLGLILAGRPGLFPQAAHPAERLSAILADAAPAAVVGEPRADLVMPPNTPFMTMNDALAAIPADPVVAAVDPEGAMAVHFTSGSTGRPRGFVRGYGQALERAVFQWREAGIRPGEHLCSLNGLAVGTAASWLLTAVLAGASFSVANPAELGLRGLGDVLGRRRPALLITIPSLMRLVMEAPNLAAALAGLRLIYTVSEPLSRDELVAWRARLPAGTAVLMSFGMTECGSIAGWFAPPNLAKLPNKIPVGFPRSNYEYALIDEDGATVSQGERGMLWVRGSGQSIGEWRGGRVASSVGVPDPERPGQFIFPTNDLFRERPDGMLEHIGRADDVVKLRGNRVDLSEVELALRAVPMVADAGVVARDGAASTELYAFVVAAPNATLRAGDVIAHLRGRVPSAMIPTRVVPVVALPRLPNGKLDRQTLLARLRDEGGTA